MSGLRGVPPKQRREVRRRNHVALDLYTRKYQPHIRESNRQHLIDEVQQREAEYELLQLLGLASKE